MLSELHDAEDPLPEGEGYDEASEEESDEESNSNVLVEGRIARTSNFVDVCFSPARLKQRTKTRTQTIRLPLRIDQTVCSRFRGYVSLIQGFFVLSLNVIPATNSYSPSHYSKSGGKNETYPYTCTLFWVFSLCIPMSHSARLLSSENKMFREQNYENAFTLNNLYYNLNISDLGMSGFGRNSDRDM